MSTHVPGFKSFFSFFYIILYWPNYSHQQHKSQNPKLSCGSDDITYSVRHLLYDTKHQKLQRLSEDKQENTELSLRLSPHEQRIIIQRCITIIYTSF